MIRQHPSDMQNANEVKSKWLAKLSSRLRLANLAWKTEQSYCRTVSQFWDAAAKMPSDWTREQKVEEWLSAQVRERDISASTQNCQFSAILYFFRHVIGKPLENVNALRAKRKATFRISVSREQTMALLAAVPDIGGYQTNFLARLLYACGMRVTEPLNLRIKDIDLTNCRLDLWDTKGGKCRRVSIPCQLIGELKAQIELTRAMWKQDLQRRLPTELPGALSRKYPSRIHAWEWYWLFPQRIPCTHPRTGQTVRYRMHESNVQRAVKIAAKKVGLEGIITPHNLRHCFGAHVADSGQNMRALQLALGHKSLETTMGYVHSDGLTIRSPLAFT